MSLRERQDKAAAELVRVLEQGFNGRLDEDARAVLMRVCSGHERRTVDLLTQAAVRVRRCLSPMQLGLQMASIGFHQPPPPASLLVRAVRFVARGLFARRDWVKA